MAIQKTAREKAKITRRLREFLVARSEIEFAYLHGTFVGEAPFNDIDVTIYLNSNVGDEFDYAMDLSVEATLLLHIPVDVQTMNHAPLSFQHPVLHSGKLLFARNELFLAEYLERLSLEYMDFAHHLPDYLEALTT
jgi:predicted nucleotidyltransferase